MRFLTFTLLAALGSGLINGCSEGPTRPTAAMVLSVKGDVVFGIAGQRNFQPVTRESRIYDGHIVRTSDGALLDLGLTAGAIAQVSGNSEVKVEELRISKDGDQTRGGMRGRNARIQLSGGKITVLCSERGGGTSQFAISTSAVTVTVDSECFFCVRKDARATRVTCVRGKVQAATETEPLITIGAGYFQEWPSTRPEPVAVTADVEAQLDVMDSLEIENELRELSAGWRERRPF